MDAFELKVYEFIKLAVQTTETLQTCCEQLTLKQEFMQERMDVLEDRLEQLEMPRGKKAKTVEVNQDQGTLIAAWRQIADWLSKAKVEEHEKRNALVLSMPFDKNKFEGSESLDIGYDWKLKCTKVQTYSATNENQEATIVYQAISAIDPGIAQALFKWEPVVSAKTYKEQILPLAEQYPHLKELLSKCITVKPGMPQLELVPPKAAQETVTPTADNGVLVTDGSGVTW